MSAKKKLIGNSFSMIVNRLTQGITTFVLTTAMARSLGAYQLGQYVLAISYYYIFVNIVSQGFKTLFTREIAKEPEATPIYLINGSLVQFIFSIFGYLGLVALVFVLPYSDDTTRVCYIMGLAVIPFALSNITEAIFQAQEQMHLITIATVPVYILRLLIMIWVMQLKYGVDYVAGIMVASEAIILIIQWLLLTQQVKLVWKIDKDFIWHKIKAARTFFAIEGTGIIASKMDVLIMSLLANEFLIGLYGSVGQLKQPFLIIANSVALSAFPAMSKSILVGKQEQRKITEDILEILLLMSLPFSTALLFLGSDLLTFVYQNPEFAQATILLQVSALTLTAYPFVKVLGYTLVANGFEKFNLMEVLVTTTLGSITGIFLISQYKLSGAAIMMLITALSAFSLNYYIVYTRLFSLKLLRIFRRPLLVSGLMSLVFLLLKQWQINFLWTAIIATFAYVVFTGILTIQTLGGFSVVWPKILKLPRTIFGNK